jgi:hypothetical protein
MTARTVDDIAALIREVDGDNTMDSNVLGQKVAERILPVGDIRVADMAGFIGWTNPDKTLGAGALAELIVAEFDLDKQH